MRIERMDGEAHVREAFNECALALSAAVAKTVRGEIQKMREKCDIEIQRVKAVSLARSREQTRQIAALEREFAARVNRLVERGLADIEEEAQRSARRKSNGEATP